MRSLPLLVLALSSLSAADAQSSFTDRPTQVPRATAVSPGAVEKITPTQQATRQSVGPSAPGATFRAGDMFNLKMTGMPIEYAQTYQLDFTIGGDGFINIPLGGQIRAAGLTQSQLERAIEKKLIDEKIFRWPTATINVSPGARFVTIGGNVRAPSRLQWSADLSVLSSLSACGGPSDFAGDRINLIRSGQLATYSYKKLKKNPADDPRLNPGDQVDLQ
jgi:protein involved in polysaccharide export with SLBB domain